MKAPHVLQMITLRGHSFLPGPIGPDSVVVDLGANRGEFSQRVQARFGCRCFAVEPTPRLFREIQQIPELRAFNYAINDRDELVTFHISASEVRSSLLDNLERATGEHVTIQGRTLESFMAENQLARINLLKADIEGAEVRLFESTSDEVLKRIDQITIEFHDFCGMMTEDQIVAIRRRLARLGFDEMRFDGNNMNWLFVNRAAPGMHVARRVYVKHIVRRAREFLHWFRRRIGMRQLGLSTE